MGATLSKVVGPSGNEQKRLSSCGPRSDFLLDRIGFASPFFLLFSFSFLSECVLPTSKAS